MESTKAQQLADEVRCGAYRIDGDTVFRRVEKDHPFSGAKAGDWVLSNKWRADVVLRARVILDTPTLRELIK
jgi:hypothetical protein